MCARSKTKCLKPKKKAAERAWLLIHRKEKFEVQKIGIHLRNTLACPEKNEFLNNSFFRSRKFWSIVRSRLDQVVWRFISPSSCFVPSCLLLIPCPRGAVVWCLVLGAVTAVSLVCYMHGESWHQALDRYRPKQSPSVNGVYDRHCVLIGQIVWIPCQQPWSKLTPLKKIFAPMGRHNGQAVKDHHSLAQILDQCGRRRRSLALSHGQDAREDGSYHLDGTDGVDIHEKCKKIIRQTKPISLKTKNEQYIFLPWHRERPT